MPAHRLRVPRGSAAVAALSLTVALCGASLAGAQAAPPRPAAGAASGAASPTVAYQHLTLPDGSWATVYSDGLAVLHRGGRSEIQHLPLLSYTGDSVPTVDSVRSLPPVGQLMSDLMQGHQAPYAASQVLVVYRAGVSASATFHTSAAALRTPGHRIPAYTSDSALNATLATLGVDGAGLLFAGATHARVVALHAAAERSEGHALLDYAHAYVLHLTNASVEKAVATLRSNPAVAYAEPNWTVSTTHTPSEQVSSGALRKAVAAARRTQTPAAAKAAKASGVPDNYALSSSAQALLNRPGVDAVPAFNEIAQQSHQLPGQGEVITNVSLGTLDDASAGQDPTNPCYNYVSSYGPTTEVLNGQRYIDWPSMPLIPTYTANADAVLDPTGQTCGDDPTLTEVGLDFSMMAPLPHDAQRPGHEGSGLTDLLGIAPGADYRLVLPSTPGGAVSDVDAAFLAAAMQTPRPNIITASLSFGMDQYGFAARFLEDDPMTEALLSSIVHAYHIVVTVSSNDGLRQFTNAAVSPAGGSVATEVARHGSAITDINDIAYSDAPSRDYDSGSIDVGGSTLDDIFSAPPQDPRNRALKAVHAFPATRYNGARNYSSGFGSRVNLSAPGDNVLSLMHAQGGDAQTVSVVVEGGTSASAPEVAATAAVVQQVARLTGNKKLAKNPLAMRSYLEQTGNPLPDVAQADRTLHVGAQVDLGAAVSALYAAAGATPKAGAPRVAVEQRQQGSALGGSITTATDPTNISLTGKLGYAWITISPDWVGLPDSGVTYKLRAATGPAKRLATTAWARLQPSEILAAAGLSLPSSEAQTVPLVYTASAGGHVIVRKAFSLTFGAADGTTPAVLAPIVKQVSTGSTIAVSYDITNLTGATDPTLVVSQPGRIDPATGLYFRPAYTVELTDPTGTVDVPVSALQGGGIYGIGIQNAPGGWFEQNDSAYAFTRVAPASTDQPAPPTLSQAGSPSGHYLEIGYGTTFQLHYDVRNVAGATGAYAEFSAPGPNVFNNYETFNNPSGSQRDANGHDTGSVAFVKLPSTHGTVTLDSAQLGLSAAMDHLVRVLPVRGGAAAGEASGVSMIQMDGVLPKDGGSLVEGFGVNENGGDGMLTSMQSTADGGYLGSVETFDQASAAITGVPTSGTDYYSTVEGGCAGLFAGDVGLYDDWNPATEQDTYQLLDPVATGTLGGTWDPPGRTGALQCLAHNESSPRTALLSGYGGTQPTFKVTSTNVATGAFSKSVSLLPGLAGIGLATYGGFGVNGQTGDAVVATNDAFEPSNPPRIVVANPKTGDVTGFDGVTSGFVSGAAVDSTANLAAIGSNEGFGIYDLATQTGTLVQPGGSGYQHPGVDAVDGLFLVQEVAPPTFSGETPDNNVTSSIVVTDTTGTIQERISGFNFYNIYLSNAGDYLQLNPATRTGFTLGPGGSELEPFHF